MSPVVLGRSIASTASVTRVLTERAAASMSARCPHCGAPLIETSAYPKPGRRLACLAGNATAAIGRGALPCGATR